MEKVYKVIYKKDRNQAFWDDQTVLIVASSYSNAVDKAVNYGTEREIFSIQAFGETTGKKDVFKVTER